MRGMLRKASAMLGRPFTVDLTDAHAFENDIAGYNVYNIVGQGRIVPPSGKYQVILFDTSCEQGNGTPAEIEVDEQCIVIKKGDYNLVEFLC